MSTNSRVQAFLQRASKTTSSTRPKAVPNLTSPKARLPSPRKSDQSRASPLKSPVPNTTRNSQPHLPASFNQTQTPKAKSPSPLFKSAPRQKTAAVVDRQQPKLLDYASMNEIQGTLQNLIDKRENLRTKLKKQQEQQQAFIDSIKDTLKKAKTKQPLTAEKAEEAYKAKAEKILTVVKEEALVMDKKLSKLQQENQELRKALESPVKIPESPPDNDQEYTIYIDNQLLRLFQQYDQNKSPEVCLELSKALSKKLLHEKFQRLKTEKQAKHMIEQQEKLISSLKERVLVLEAKSTAESVEFN